MAQTVREIMTQNPVTLPRSASITEAAKRMRDDDIGDVIVMDDGDMCGLVTDRDIVVRAVAEGADPQFTKVDEICTHDLVTVAPGDSLQQTAQLMRERAVRRVPVVEGGRPVGIVSLGDLAIELDEQSGLADISAAESNN
jgi:signal-transduction protein with cAMP-binding, CBS, and nucleotidyltransferase domain